MTVPAAMVRAREAVVDLYNLKALLDLAESIGREDRFGGMVTIAPA
jgi:hypothetical protein